MLNENISYNALKKRNHLCICCKRQDAYTLGGRSLCYDCAEKQRLAKRVYMRENAEKIHARKKKARERYVKEHRCVRCGKSLPDGYPLKTCKKCLARCAEGWKRYTIKRYGFDEYWRKKTHGKNGLCWQCNKKPIEIGKMCKDCHAAAVERGLKSLQYINKEKHIWRAENELIKHK